MPLLMSGGFCAHGKTSLRAEHGLNVLSDERSARYVGAIDCIGEAIPDSVREFNKAIHSHGFAGSQFQRRQRVDADGCVVYGLGSVLTIRCC